MPRQPSPQALAHGDVAAPDDVIVLHGQVANRVALLDASAEEIRLNFSPASLRDAMA